MDISQIDNTRELKAMAYDTIGRLEVEQRNLQMIQARIIEVERDTAITEAPDEA